MKKITILLLFLILFSYSIYGLNYITTAESISWNGAYTSVADGFEALLYNPAGLYFTQAKYGINILGSYGFRFYTNSLSSDDFRKLFQAMQTGQNITKSGVLDNILLFMPATGFDLGMDFSGANIMTYFKYNKFSLGISFIPKTYMTTVLSRELFTTIFQRFDLTEPLDLNMKVSAVQYLDLNVSLSTRAEFLEKVIPVEKIFVGMSGHFYFPTFYTRTNSLIRLSAGKPDSKGFIDNYIFRIKGGVLYGGNRAATEIVKNIPASPQYLGAYSNYGGSAAFGLGFDFGFLIQFNRFFRLGFAVTDIGFMVFPHMAKVDMDLTADLNLDNATSFVNTIMTKTQNALQDDDEVTYASTEWLMPNTAVRFGIALTPFKSGILTVAADISISDLNRIALQEYPTFNFSTGVEFLPGYKWFAFLLRVAFNYNSQANNASFSFGTGLYLGPVEMEIGVKGLEFLFLNLGAKEVAVGVDFKFEF